MRGELVALDLETTGLDVENDSIIEIGAVRLRDGEILDEFGMLINPGFVIPAETTHITGIHQDDLRHAPRLPEALPQISEFVGDAPVIAHNVSFDISFMRRFGTLKKNLPIDTYELASILLPRVPRYSLSSLSAEFEIDLENAHRALDDARATAILYWELWKKLTGLPLHILQEINRAMTNITWETGEVFRAALATVEASTSAEPVSVIDIFEPLESDTQPLAPVAEPQLLDIEEIVSALGADGTLARNILNYEYRAQQGIMASAIAESFNTDEHLIIEAGTGTGKSLAYLLPAAQWAVTNNQRVVISTNTINLQDQLMKHDVPIVETLVNGELKASVMKGRGNYLCPRRLAAVRRRTPANLDELRTMAKILVWLQESQTGDRGEISLRSREYFVWNRLSAEDEGCTTHRCMSQMKGTCPYYKARKRAESSHIVIANHALLISDAVSENRVLPEYDYLIVDEAHQLEDAITFGLSTRLDMLGLLRRLSDLGGINRGLLGDLLRSVRDSAPDKIALRLEAFIQNISDAVKAAEIHTRKFFNAVYQFTIDSRSDRMSKIRIDDKRRNHGAFSNVKGAWETLADFLEAIVEAMDELANALTKLEKYKIQSYDDHMHAATAAVRNLRESYQHLQALVQAPDASVIYWINNASSAEYMSVQSAPLHVGSLMEEYIWHQKKSAILTSATLTTAGSFDFMKHRLYADDVKEFDLGSPFDYKESTLVYVPDDIPMPNESGYQRAVERGIVDLAAALDGRVLVLFTSYTQLRETAANISPRLALGNITVYDQATGGSRESLLDSFKSTEKAVLLGTRSFWEGVDIPGEDLSALVIVRLPFAVPTDPVFSSRSDGYRDAFQEFAVPEAILRFRQGFGRLIRTQTDRGVVALLDSRVINKSYGMKFLESLPDCTLQYGKLAEIGKVTEQWLKLDKS